MFNIIKNSLQEKNLVVDNDYLTKYINLILDNLHTDKQKYITHKHHIIPRYYYKHKNLPLDNSPDNIVNLRYSDHILCHYYLSMCSSCKKFKDSNLCGIRRIIRGFNPESDEAKLIGMLPEIQAFYEEIKHVNCLKPDTPQKISSSIRGRISVQNHLGQFKYIYPDELANFESAGWHVGHNLQTDGSKSKISQANSGRKHIRKDGVVKSVKEADVELYLLDGWLLGDGPRSYSSTKGKICIFKEDNNKYIFPEELSDYEKMGWSRGNTLIGTVRPESCKRKFTLEDRILVSAQHLGRVSVHKDNQYKYVFPSELDSYLQSGWRRGTGCHNSPGARGKVWITDGVNNRYIALEDIDSMPEGWRRGRYINKNK